MWIWRSSFFKRFIPEGHGRAGRRFIFSRVACNDVNAEIGKEMHGMRARTKILVTLILLSMVDMVIPFPILGVILISVLFNKPHWFEKLVGEIYHGQ